jgi:hypothetical protein
MRIERRISSLFQRNNIQNNIFEKKIIKNDKIKKNKILKKIKTINFIIKVTIKFTLIHL